MRAAVALCAEAINVISERSQVMEGDALSPAHASRGVTMQLRRAQKMVDGSDPGSCLSPLRMHLEAICDDLIDMWQVVVKSGPRERLGDKLSALQSHVEKHDKWMFAQMCGINKLTDFGSHHSQDLLDRVTLAEVKPVLEISESLHRRFLEL